MSELHCGIPSWGTLVYVTPSVYPAIVLSVRKFLIHRYMLLCIPASLIFMKRPCLEILSCLFQINKDSDRVFLHLQSMLNLLCESNQLVFCGVVTSENSLA